VSESAVKNSVSFSAHFVVSKLFDPRCHRWVPHSINALRGTPSALIALLLGRYPNICSVISSNVFVAIFWPMRGHVCAVGGVPTWGGFLGVFFRWRGVLKGLGWCGVFSWMRGCLLGVEGELSLLIAHIVFAVLPFNPLSRSLSPATKIL